MPLVEIITTSFPGFQLLNRLSVQHREAIRAAVEGGGLDLLGQRNQSGTNEEANPS